MKKTIIAVFVLLAIFAVWKFFPGDVQDSEKSNWQTFQNIKHGYSVQYPDFVKIYTDNDYSGPDLTDEDEVDFGVPGKTTLFQIQADYIDPESLNIFKQKATAEEIGKVEKMQELISLDLRSYAESIRNMQISNSNPNIKAEVGSMQEIEFAGKPSFSFSLNKGFITLAGGYALGNGQDYNYIITENSNGRKMIVHYLIASETYPEGVNIAKEMLKSFKFE